MATSNMQIADYLQQQQQKQLLQDQSSQSQTSEPPPPSRERRESYYGHPIIDFLLSHNRKQSELYTSPDAEGSRVLYKSQHPTDICALKCMDGRLNLSIITQTPAGIITPYRNIGGKFDVGWPHFGQVLDSWVSSKIDSGRRCLALVTYHFSKGDPKRGCAGHGYDTDAARAGAFALVSQIERVFGGNHTCIHPIVVGIETDEDTLVLHGKNDQIFNVCDNLSQSSEQMRSNLQRLYPDMQAGVINDLLPLIEGNARHINHIRSTNRPITEAEHKEQVLAVGRGFDWLHLPNKALIVGPYSYNLGDPIATAGSLLLSNLKDGRIPKGDGVVLLACAMYRDGVGFERFRAVEKAKSLARFALNTLRTRQPELVPHLKVLVGTVNDRTRLMQEVEFDADKE